MKRASLYFTAPGQAEIRQEALAQPGEGQALVQVLLSAISPGSELLIYRGQFPKDIPIDAGIAALSGDFNYPLKYGYATIGRVVAAGAGVNPEWIGGTVFAFHPHESHFLATPEELLPLPDGLSAENGLFLPNMETAVNFLMDGAPLIGEKVAVFGQGIVGLLTTALLARFPLDQLVTLDRHPLRRSTSLALGAHASLDPIGDDTPGEMRALFPDGADLTFELSGAPAGLEQAIANTGFAGRVIIGSWYGSKRLSLDLGGRFHRSRIRLISSQVTTLAPELGGRWTKRRRFEVAWDMIRKIQPSRFITQRFPIQEAPQAYRLIDQEPQETIQVVFTY
jgi:2-desacetyl-2-hydroxyethyl bacteriochlorophyllide A dehydrogenase